MNESPSDENKRQRLGNGKQDARALLPESTPEPLRRQGVEGTRDMFDDDQGADRFAGAKFPADGGPHLQEPARASAQPRTSGASTASGERARDIPAAATELEERMARAQLAEKGWRDRPELSGLLQDLAEFSERNWRAVASLWDKFRPDDHDKPPFVDGDDKDPSTGKQRSERSDISSAQQSQRSEGPNDLPAHPLQSQKDLVAMVPETLTKRFHLANNRFYFREDQNLLAFEDFGRHLISEHNDPDVARSMVELAHAKGWGTIKVSGADAFRRQVWLAASLKGIDVKGHEPSELDLAKAEELKQQAFNQARKRGRDQAREPVVTTEFASASMRDETALRRAMRESHRSGAERGLTRAELFVIEALSSILSERGDAEVAVRLTTEMAAARLRQERGNRNTGGKSSNEAKDIAAPAPEANERSPQR